MDNFLRTLRMLAAGHNIEVDHVIVGFPVLVVWSPPPTPHLVASPFQIFPLWESPSHLLPQLSCCHSPLCHTPLSCCCPNRHRHKYYYLERCCCTAATTKWSLRSSPTFICCSQLPPWGHCRGSFATSLTPNAVFQLLPQCGHRFAVTKSPQHCYPIRLLPNKGVVTTWVRPRDGNCFRDSFTILI